MIMYTVYTCLQEYYTSTFTYLKTSIHACILRACRDIHCMLEIVGNAAFPQRFHQQRRLPIINHDMAWWSTNPRVGPEKSRDQWWGFQSELLRQGNWLRVLPSTCRTVGALAETCYILLEDWHIPRKWRELSLPHLFLWRVVWWVLILKPRINKTECPKKLNPLVWSLGCVTMWGTVTTLAR